MSISSTNSVHNSPKDRKYALERAVKDKMIEKSINQKRQRRWKMRNLKGQLSTCAKCHRGMNKIQADAQLENKENMLEFGHKELPVCMACIMGMQRKEL